jgi:hypothetical protein
LLDVPKRTIVIRSIILLAIALALGTGDSLTLLCRATCDRAAWADVDACHHGPSAVPLIVRDDQSCGEGGTPVIAEIRNQTQQTKAAGPRTSSAIVVSHELPTVTSEHALFSAGRPRLPVENRPSDTALRI